MGTKSSTWREVDVSLRSKVGSADVLIILECRDRKRLEDVAWIEQISAKAADVGASKSIAVSAAGFSKAAETLALAHNIDLRTIDSVDPIEYISDLSTVPVYRVAHRCKFLGVNLTLDARDDAKLSSLGREFIAKLLDPNATMYRWEGADAACSIQDVWQSTGSKMFGAYERIPLGEKHRVPIRYNLTGKLHLETPLGPLRVEAIDFDALLWSEATRLAPQEVNRYRTGASLIADRVRYEMDYEGASIGVTHLNVPSGETHTAVEAPVAIEMKRVVLLPEEFRPGASVEELWSMLNRHTP